MVGLVIALWSANAGMKAIFDALNVIYDEDEKRGLIWLNVESLFFTMCGIGGSLLVTPEEQQAFWGRLYENRVRACCTTTCTTTTSSSIRPADGWRSIPRVSWLE